MADMLKLVGKWAFIAGLVISIIAGFWTLNATLITVLMVLGLIVGFLNVSPKESKEFLFAAVALLLVSYFGGTFFANVQAIGPVLQSIFGALMSFVLPATVVVAAVALFSVARD